MTVSSQGRVVLRASSGNRVAAWLMIAFGVLFGFAGLVGNPDNKPRDWGATVLMIAFSVLVAGIGTGILTAKVVADESGLSYRHGLVHRHLRTAEIAAIDVGSGSGVTPRLALRVTMRNGKVQRLVALQQQATAKSEAQLQAKAEQIRAATRVGSLPAEGSNEP